MSSSASFEEELARAIDEEAPGGIVVDLSRVTFMDSTALSSLVRCFEMQRTRLRDMSIVCSDPRVLVLLEVTHLDRVISIYPTREQALAAPAR